MTSQDNIIELQKNCSFAVFQDKRRSWITSCRSGSSDFCIKLLCKHDCSKQNAQGYSNKQWLDYSNGPVIEEF
jgi:hypothetical protein